ncbi:ABC transporter ATP-binding protein [Microcoleus vaginatus PCC 9802]|uniref:ABC transporter ATP-binding protein n=1 Tax=Microcoleus vaginatus TaxID=119532 RepID=UPI00020D1D21|nr:Xenobiotic-transporting ATPase [Microcoleus vaginatus FGP-2]UNU17807.1 ABC transporter ATP-binding protein [Microcoleus vaginatus PCC 9802]
MSANKLLLKFARRYPGRILLTVMLGFSGALFNGISTTLIVPVLLSFLEEAIELRGAPPLIKTLMYPFEGMPGNQRLMLMTGAVVLAIFLKNVASYINTLVATSLTRSLTFDLREAGLRLLLGVDLDFYSKTKVGDLINRLGGEIGRTASAVGTAIGMFTTSITVLVFVGLLLSISWKLTLTATVLLALVAWTNQFIINRSKHFGHLLSEMSKDYSVRVLETITGIRLVKSTGNEEREYQRIKHLIQRREQADFQAQVNYAAIAPINEVVNLIVIILIVFIGRTIFANEIESLATILLTYLLVLFRLIPLISQLNSGRSQFANTSASVEVVNDFLSCDDKPFMLNGSVPYTQLRSGIHFNKISFSYPNHKNLVLQGIDLFLPHGTTLALVGTSGSGKSTLADLLPRFYDPTEGHISIDGRDLRDFELTSLRQAMGIVSQDTFLFNASVRENIAYARPQATEEEIVEAAKGANAYEFIQLLPEGLDTQIGDRGVILSGGQRQRISIARALLQNPEILILDEATSSLDTVSERYVQGAIEKLSCDRTTLVIAHRLSTVQKANKIAVIDRGQVVEMGSHEELLAKGGYYTRLYSVQFAEETARDEALIRGSYEIRTRLTPMIAYLKLLVDEMVDSPEERDELIRESFHSAANIFTTLEFIEKTIKRQAVKK